MGLRNTAYAKVNVGLNKTRNSAPHTRTMKEEAQRGKNSISKGLKTYVFNIYYGCYFNENYSDVNVLFSIEGIQKECPPAAVSVTPISALRDGVGVGRVRVSKGTVSLTQRE